MKIITRRSHTFTELKVDEITETIWKEDESEIDDFIFNLFDTISDLADMNDLDIYDYLKKYNNQQ